MIEETKLTFLNPSGRVITANGNMKKELLAKGFRMIVNPKEEYYPSYDKSNYGTQDWNVIENIETSNYLEVTKL